MDLPYMENIVELNKRYVVNFQGINYGQNVQDGQLSDCLNLSSDSFPCLSQREDRTVVQTLTSPTALFARGKLCWVDGTDFVYNGVNKGTVATGEKQFAVVGARVIIFPDKKYYNTTDDTFGSLEASYTATASSLTFTATTITSTGDAFSMFKAGDGLEITGCTTKAENNKTIVVREVSGQTLTFYDNSFEACTEAGAVTIARKIPDLDYICESNNRLWGCGDGQIFGSKLGDPFNFYCYDGLASDSYAVAVGSDGEFTGCIGYSTHIAFFKENTVHKMFGQKPSNYQLVEGRIQGVQAGCHKSMRIINETLYYKSRAGIMAYTGSVPELVSDVFGNKRYGNAVAAATGTKYYISMQCGTVWDLFSYDVLKGIWLREDNTQAVDFAELDGEVYYISGTKVYKLGGGTGEVEWSATMVPFNETIMERKGYSRLFFRIDLSAGAYIRLEVSHDDGPWKTLYTARQSGARMVTVPIMPRRCDKFEVRLSGKGKCKVHALAREFHIGSEV